MDDKIPPKDFIDQLNEDEAAKKAEQDKKEQVQAINKAGIKNVEATDRNTKSTAEGLKNVKGEVKVTNPDLAKSDDLQKVVDSVNKMNMTAFITNDGLPKLAENLSTLSDKVKTLSDNYQNEGLSELSAQLGKVVDKLDGVSKKLTDTKIKVDVPLQKTIDGLQKSIAAIDFKPQVNVASPEAKVVTTPINLEPVTKALGDVLKAVKDNKPENEQVDLEPVTSGLQAVQNAITSLRFPVPNYILPFKDANGKDVQVQLDASGNIPTSGGGSGGGGTQYTDGGVTPAHPTGTAQVFNKAGTITAVSDTNPLPVSATISTAGLATGAAQTDGSQKTKLVDASGNTIGSTNNLYLDTANFGVDNAGAFHQILTDTGGRTKISHGQPTPTTGTIDAVASQIAVASDGFSDAVFTFVPLGSHIITFEYSPDSTDGSNGTWFAALAANQGASAVAATTATITTVNVSYRVSAPAASWMRARVSTQTTPGSIAAQAITTTAAAQPQVTSTLSSAAVTLASTTLLPSATVGGTITPFFLAAMTTKTTVKATAGSVLHVNFYNPNTTDVYIQWFNVAVASVTMGTTAPIRSYWIPAKGSYTDDFTYYPRYATAITIGPWSVADNSAGSAPALGIVTNVDYI